MRRSMKRAQLLQKAQSPSNRKTARIVRSDPSDPAKLPSDMSSARQTAQQVAVDEPAHRALVSRIDGDLGSDGEGEQHAGQPLRRAPLIDVRPQLTPLA